MCTVQVFHPEIKCSSYMYKTMFIPDFQSKDEELVEVELNELS